MIGRATIVSGLLAAGLLLQGVAVAAPTVIDGGASATAVAVRGEQFAVGDAPVPPEPQTARYRVTLNIVWSATTHPATIPPASTRPHVSAPVIATHAGEGAMFQRGALASPGIEAMAETGATGGLVIEMATNPTVTGVMVGSSIFDTNPRTFDIELRQDADMVSLVTMLAPSPDWFVGVNSVPMFVDGAWVTTFEGDLVAYDAGTDSAPGFVHSNSDTNPAQPISGPRDVPFANADAEGRFGFVTITRLP